MNDILIGLIFLAWLIFIGYLVVKEIVEVIRKRGEK